MKPIKFNYRPDIAAKTIDAIVEQNEKDPDCTEEQRKVYEDMQTLVHLGLMTLSAEPSEDPAIPGVNKNIS